MGAAFYPVLEKNNENIDTATVNGKSLSKHNEKLEEIAKLLAVKPLISFFGEDTSEFLEDEDVEIKENWETNEKWFEAGEGLKTINSLLEYLTENPQAFESANYVIDDLRAFELILSEAQKQNIKWHLAIDF